MNVTSYWEPQDLNISYEDACKEFLYLLKQSIRARLRRAYPTGCELSGGLDSSSVVCLASRYSEGVEILPFSLRYGNMACDEGKYIKSVLEKLGKSSCPIDVNLLDFQNNYTIESFYTKSPDWPIKGSFLPHLEITKQAKRNRIRVLLTGHGGDHVSTGNIYGILDDLRRFQFVKAFYTIKNSNNKKLLLRLLLKKNITFKNKNCFKLSEAS